MRFHPPTFGTVGMAPMPGGAMFGAFEAGSVWQIIGVAPEFVWESSLGVWRIVEGFYPSSLAYLSTNPDDGVSTNVRKPAAVPSNGRVPSRG